jgi:protein-disulfide isomerase
MAKLEQAQRRLLVPVTESDHIRGPKDALVTLVEYGDYECPWCAKAHPLLAELRERIGEKFRLVFRHFPQSTIHAHASVAAQAAEAAAAQTKFWDMHDLLYANQDRLAEVDLAQLALRAGLELYQFQSDLASGRFARRVQQDYEGGVYSGVSGTPTFFANDVRFEGPLSLQALQEQIERLATKPTS